MHAPRPIWHPRALPHALRVRDPPPPTPPARNGKARFLGCDASAFEGVRSGLRPHAGLLAGVASSSPTESELLGVPLLVCVGGAVGLLVLCLAAARVWWALTTRSRGAMDPPRWGFRTAVVHTRACQARLCVVGGRRGVSTQRKISWAEGIPMQNRLKVDHTPCRVTCIYS